MQQETDDILSSVFLLSESFFEGSDSDVEDSAFGIGLELVVAVDGEVRVCGDVDLFDPAEALADFEQQIGFVFGFDRVAEVVDGGVFFVAADLCGQAGGKLPAFLQGFASFIRGTVAMFPPLFDPALRLEVVFGHGQQFAGDTPHYGTGVGGVFEQRTQAVVEPVCVFVKIPSVVYRSGGLPTVRLRLWKAASEPLWPMLMMMLSGRRLRIRV